MHSKLTKKFGKIIKSIIFALSVYCNEFVFAEKLPTVVLIDGSAHVTTPGGKKQVLWAGQARSASDVKLLDLTFDGSSDILLLRKRGANQEFYDVYLYSKERDTYIFDERLSDIPCLGVDVQKKQLMGQCFHESACENWEEYYSVSPKGWISLIERRGTYCDPITGQGYTYSDRYRNGKKISSKVSPLDK